MADDDIGPTSFVPDDLDDQYFGEEEVDLAGDEDAYAEMEAEMAAREQRVTGQAAPRKLDFGAYGLGEGGSGSQRLSSLATQQATAPLSQGLDLNFDAAALAQASLSGSQAASRPMTTFERAQAEERRHEAQQARSRHPLATVSSAGAPSVLPALHRSVSDMRAKVLHGDGVDERLYVYRRAPVLGESVSVTTAKGERVFLTMNTDEEAAKRLAAHAAMHRTQQMHRELGQTNVRNLMRQLDDEATAASIVASRALAATMELESDVEDDERTRLRKRRQRKEKLVKRLDEADQRQRLSAKNKQLWVDKYAPKGYADLLSPEQINREVLAWLKGWDTCVFGEKKAPEPASTIRTLDSQMLTNNVLAAKTKKPPTKMTSADGETDIRPEHKVILLCGPPGLGKTTLAHILARQAGYHPFEINASDDRNATALESKIRAATEMQAVSFGTDHAPKPNCVIIDEIDGVSNEAGEGGAIAALLKIVQAEGRKKITGKKDADTPDDNGGGSETDDDEQQAPEDDAPAAKPRKAKGGGKRGGGSSNSSPPGPLKRPIICICNDQFSAALRPLRQIARIFEFTAAPKSKFVERLRWIAGKEGMEYEPRTLAALADVVDMDIRSALNTLQFVHSKGQKLTAASLNNLAVGRKDVEKSRFQVWDAVFCDREVKRDNLLHFRDHRETQQHGTAAAAMHVSTHSAKAKELQGLLSDSGDMDKIMEGIFHNYPSVGFPDPSFHKTVECADWLAYADLLDSRISSQVEMSLMQYTPYAAIAIHSLTARPRRVMLEAPSMFYQQWVEAQRNQHIVRSFLSPSNRLTLDGVTLSSAVMDVLPFVLDILHPTIRAVNYALLTGKEKSELSNLIDTMLGLSITFRPEVQSAFVHSSAAAWQARPADTNVIYKLEPAIDLLCAWTDPLDAASGRKFEPKDKFGNPFPKKQPWGRPALPAAATSASSASFQIAPRDVNMPGKVKQMVLREIEFEAMRRAEAKIKEKNADQQKEATMKAPLATATNGDMPPPSPLAACPAVQRLLDAEKRKREMPADALTSPSAAAAAAALLDESPATKRAKVTAGLNFLNAHADAAKNKRNRGRTPGGAAGEGKLQLAGLPTLHEQKTNGQHAPMDLTSDGDATATPVATQAPQPHGASVLSRFTHPLHFRYNEGCTNAVRRTVHTQHFLPIG